MRKCGDDPHVKQKPAGVQGTATVEQSLEFWTIGLGAEVDEDGWQTVVDGDGHGRTI